MKLKTISLQIPEKTDAAYKAEAVRRMVSKSSVMRGVLVEHVRTNGNGKQPKAAGTSSR